MIFLVVMRAGRRRVFCSRVARVALLGIAKWYDVTVTVLRLRVFLYVIFFLVGGFNVKFLGKL